tara:strand:+ start:378 stop:1007 length:630 start_codon:yes stop_codon:yes gene_type:complete
LTFAALSMGRTTIDTTGFDRMVRDLAFIQGKDFRAVIRDEATAILKRAATGTKAAKVADIKNKHDQLEAWFEQQERDGKWISPDRRRRKHGVLKNKIAKALQRRGMAKGTWYLIGRQLGLEVPVSKYAKSAADRLAGKLGRSISGTEEGTRRYVITIKNRAIVPMLYNVKGYGAFKRALAGRLSYFDRRLKERFRERAKKAAKGAARVT